VSAAHGQPGQDDHGARTYHRRADDQGSRPVLRSAAAVLAITHGKPSFTRDLTITLVSRLGPEIILWG
jgi:hypothetical protein